MRRSECILREASTNNVTHGSGEAWKHRDREKEARKHAGRRHLLEDVLVTLARMTVCILV